MINHVSNFFYADNLEEMSVALTNPDNYQCILYCAKGSIQVSDAETNHLVEANDLLICSPSFVFGHYMRTPDLACQVLCIEYAYLQDIVADCFRSEPFWLEKHLYVRNNPVIHLNDFQRDLLLSYTRLLGVYLRGIQDTYRMAIFHYVAKAAVLEIMSYLDVLVENGAIEASASDLSQKDVILQKFLNLLRSPGNVHRDVCWYAEQLNITPKYLSAVCKERSGKTASAWITEYIIEEIKHLLQHSDKSVKEVGFRLGFTDTSFFCQYVRKHFGQTPNQLRKNRL